MPPVSPQRIQQLSFPWNNTLRVDTCVWITKEIGRFSILRPNTGRNVSIDCHWENESSNWHVNVPNETKVLNQPLEKFSENLSHCLSTCRAVRRAQLSAGSHQGEAAASLLVRRLWKQFQEPNFRWHGKAKFTKSGFKKTLPHYTWTDLGDLHA